ncbi:MAG: hypothetical protein PUE01_00355 [Clostridiaceae bacterium]|nr:hypothetical protein [Clostridiaceae bacterium]
MLEPLRYYADDDSLVFYLIDCGSGLMHLIIFPDKTVMLFDCNVTSDEEDRIIEFLKDHIPERYDEEKQEYIKEIDVFVNSHRDTDHLRGLKKVNSNFKIKSIWDSGQTGANPANDDYNYYMYLRRKLKAENQENLVVPTPTNSKLCTIGGTEIYCLAAEEDFVEDYDNGIRMFNEATKIQHTNSMVLLLEYGGRKMLLTGDSDWKSWKEKIVPNFATYNDNYENVDILIASHHGSRSFFTDENSNDTIDEEENPDTTYLESIKLINPVITLISCGDYKEYHHPNDDAMKLYNEWTSNKQVYTTHNVGTICGFINSDGYFSVVPDRFKTEEVNNDKGFKIICKKVLNGVKEVVDSESEVEVGCKLEFSIKSWGNIINTKDSIGIWWEVSNAGKDDDYEQHEIYCKGKNEEDGKYYFSRDLMYVGTHLLRCRIRNHSKRFDETKIFVVKGV